MHDHCSDILRVRIDVIERRQRVLLGWALSVTVLALLWGATQSAVSQPLLFRTRGIQIIDEAGNIRITLAVAPGGIPSIWLHDAEGERRLELSLATGTNPKFEMRDAQGRERIRAEVTPNGPEFRLSDAGGQRRISLFVAGSGTSVQLTDSQRPRIALVVSPDGTPQAGLFDAAGRPLFRAP